VKAARLTSAAFLCLLLRIIAVGGALPLVARILWTAGTVAHVAVHLWCGSCLLMARTASLLYLDAVAVGCGVESDPD
jgi:hypothetical protein